MKRIILILLIMLSAVGIRAQAPEKKFETVDYVEICKEVNNPQSKYYLPSLMERFQRFDTTMQSIDYFYLYYGYSCSDNYTPYDSSKYIDTMAVYMKTIKDKKELNKKMMQILPIVINELPMQMKFYEYYAMAFMYNGDTLMMKRILKCVGGIYGAIISTGDGLSEMTSYKVIYVENEKELLRFLNFDVADVAFTGSGCDRITLKPNNFKVKELYFNVGRLLNKTNTKK